MLAASCTRLLRNVANHAEGMSVMCANVSIKIQKNPTSEKPWMNTNRALAGPFVYVVVKTAPGSSCYLRTFHVFVYSLCPSANVCDPSSVDILKRFEVDE
jgi:hypothetical protein